MYSKRGRETSIRQEGGKIGSRDGKGEGGIDIGEYLTIFDSQLKMFRLYKRVRASTIFLYERGRSP